MKENKPFTHQEVKSANRRYFDLSAAFYEQVDGRRGAGLAVYLDRRLAALAEQAGGGNFLDLGCGTGFVAARAGRFFPRVTGVDISPRILSEASRRHPAAGFIAADSDALPFSAGTFNAVAGLALLHHLYDHRHTFAEVFRVLKPGGIFYTDHDLERRFRSVFHLPLLFYRLIRGEERRYGRACPQLTGRLYRATEIHREGLDPGRLGGELKAAGFRRVEISCHWLGLSPAFDRIGRLFNRQGRFPRGLAPSFSLWAVK